MHSITIPATTVAIWRVKMDSVIAGIIRRLEKLERISQRLRARDALQVSVDPVLRLTGLRGCWPMDAFDSSGDAQDCSGHGHHLGYNGNPVYSYDGLAPYIALDGTGDYLDRGDEADFDILGTESYVSVPGLTMGGWFYPEDDTTDQHLIGKWNGVGNYSYVLRLRGDVASDPARFYISDDGTNTDSVSITGIVVDTWYFIAGRYNDADAGEELKVWLNADNETAATARNSIFNSNADFTVGAVSGGGSGLYTGRASHCWLCAAALSDECIHAIFQQQRSLFGV